MPFTPSGQEMNPAYRYSTALKVHIGRRLNSLNFTSLFIRIIQN